MLTLNVEDVLLATDAKLLMGSHAVSFTQVVRDSREISQGSLFVCFAGANLDGNDFACAACEQGASVVVLTKEASSELFETAKKTQTAIMRAQNDDPTEFLLRLARYWRTHNPQWTVIGVTGSVGKTTTKDMLATALGATYKVHATKGNFNNLIGAPLTILSASKDDEVLVCEMGMNHKGELSRLSGAVRPHISLITNIGTSHIGLLGSRKNIACAKAEILESMPSSSEVQQSTLGSISSRLFLFDGNDFASFIETEFCRFRHISVEYVGTKPSSSFWIDGLSLNAQGHPHFTVHQADGWSREVCLNVFGKALAYDYLFALAISAYLGADRDISSQAIENMPSSQMRLELKTKPGYPQVIDDSYNASPSSMALALSALSSFSVSGRRIAVLGEMGELGDASERLHACTGAYAAALDLDLLIFIGADKAVCMMQAARDMGFSEDKMEHFYDVQSALKIMSTVFSKKDVILVKASRAAGLDRFVEGVLS